MRLLIKTLAFGCTLVLANNCGLAQKAAESQAELDALQEQYASFDLTCSFDDLVGSSEAESLASSSATATSTSSSISTATAASLAEGTSSCENSSEQYSVLLKQFDSDGDGSLSDTELAEAEEGWLEAQQSAMDKDGDGKISDAERAEWRDREMPGRRQKLGQHYKEACAHIGKGDEECRKMREDFRDKMREEFAAKAKDFDKDGDGKLSEAERQAMHEALRKERQEHREHFAAQVDKNGDGKISPEEREDRMQARQGAMPPPPGGKTPQGAPSGSGAPAGGPAPAPGGGKAP